MAENTNTARTVSRVIDAHRTFEGEGFPVRRAFPTQMIEDVDPFLLLDHMGPLDVEPGEAKGAPDHPHRGFETVTYMLEGSFEHKDSTGRHGRLYPGDVQWMTAGAGVVHSEMPSRELAEKGGRMSGLQLWVNLPRADKMIAPRYQEIPKAEIPEFEADDGSYKVRIIAGEADGKNAVIDTRTPIQYLHYTLKPGASAKNVLTADYNGLLYVLSGEGIVGSNEAAVGESQIAVFAADGDEVSFRVRDDAGEEFSFVLIAGKPLGEPVARYGPFVMNTREEIVQAIRDFEAGRMGVIAH